MSTNYDAAMRLGWMGRPIAFCAVRAGLGHSAASAFAVTRTGRDVAAGLPAPGFPLEGATRAELRADKLVPVLVSADRRWILDLATRRVAHNEPFLGERLLKVLEREEQWPALRDDEAEDDREERAG